MKQKKFLYLFAAVTFFAFCSSCTKKEEKKSEPQKETTTQSKSPAKPVKETVKKTEQKTVSSTKSKITFSVESSAQSIKIKFDKPSQFNKGEQYWITIVPKGATEADYGPWKNIEKGDKTVTLERPRKSGEYEVRLHSGAPYKSYNMVSKASLTIK